jgi:hypothetical protein
MSKIKEKLLNNLSPEEIEQKMGELSAFEYVELVTRYGDENYTPTDNEIEDIEKLVEEYYQSKEFKDMVEEMEVETLNQLMQTKFSESDVIDTLRKCTNDEKLIEKVSYELNLLYVSRLGDI